MSKDISFQLDQIGGQEILQKMAEPLIKMSAQAIAARASSMASSMSSNPPEITVSNTIGIIRRGIRAISTVTAHSADKHALYIGTMAIRKSRDAGRVD